jgi:hypothetical protein
MMEIALSALAAAVVGMGVVATLERRPRPLGLSVMVRTRPRRR